mmetsp:Transcript_7391/g.12927  ORF Transcript_7391/g.12927 Transcript_7391/m.12927 type:complete len:82 (+) Transcript_7391:388-633(+)
MAISKIMQTHPSPIRICNSKSCCSGSLALGDGFTVWSGSSVDALLLIPIFGSVVGSIDVVFVLVSIDTDVVSVVDSGETQS